MKLTDHSCPSCSRPLATQTDRDGVWLWCPSPFCLSVAMEHGAVGGDQAGAFKALEIAYEAEQAKDLIP